MRQVEVSRPSSSTRPRHARGFFEALVADNLDIGRPDNIEIIFARQVRRVHQGRVPHRRSTRDTDGVVVNVFYKHSRVKQYLKDGRALRIETVINAPRPRLPRRLPNLAELQAKARAVNRRMLQTERAGQGCVLASPAFERIAQPTRHRGRAEGPGPALRRLPGHGPGRRLAITLLAPTGITNKSLRALMTGLLHAPYTPAR